MFENLEVKSKCAGCALRKNKKFPCVHEAQSPWLIRLERSRALIVFEQPRTQRGQAWVKAVVQHIERGIGVQADAIVGLECETRTPSLDEEKERKTKKQDPVETLPNPFYRIFQACAVITPDIVENYDIVITLGKAIMAVTRTDDLLTWEDFAETNFNQTFFYIEGLTARKRVYPLPSDLDFLWKDNFENNTFVPRQFTKIKSYLDGGMQEAEFPEFRYEIVADPNAFLREWKDNKLEIGIDIETNGLDPFRDGAMIKCLTLAFDTTTGYYLEFSEIDVGLLSEFLYGRKQVYANGAFDVLWLAYFGVRNLELSDDVVRLFKLLYSERRKNSIKSLAWLIGVGGYDRELEELKDEYGDIDYSQIDESVLAPYACMDPVVALRLNLLGHELLKGQPVIRRAYQTILGASPAFRDMETRGVHLNTDYLSKLNADTLAQEQQVVAELASELQLDVADVSSNEKLAYSLEHVVRLPALARVVKGYYQTGESILLRWSKQGHGIADKLLKYRKLSKLRQAFLGDPNGANTSYIDLMGTEVSTESDADIGLVKSIRSDGLIHPRYMDGMAKSGRMKCYGPNISQFPAQNEEGRLFKPVLGLPGDDWYFLNMDFSGVQLRIIAVKSMDPAMINAFVKLSGDLHSVTAQAVFFPRMSLEEFMKLKSQEPYKSYRFKAKSINFGFSFGLAETTFAVQLQDEWTEEDLHTYIEINSPEIIKDNLWLSASADIRGKFFSKYAKLLPWIESNRTRGIRAGYIDDVHTGYRRHLPFLQVPSKKGRRKPYAPGDDENTSRFFNLLNVTTNTQAQSHEALHVYKAMKRIHEELTTRNLRSRMFAMIHDYLGFYVHKSEIKQVYEIAVNAAEDRSLVVPFVVETSIGKIWESGDEVTRDNIDEVARNLAA